MAQRFPAWDENVVQGVADVLGATDSGLSGSEIGALLAALGIPDPGPGVTKRHRLRQALLTRQARDGAANCVIRFITEAMAPVRYVQQPSLRTLRQDGLNEVLVFVELHLRDDGRLARGPPRGDAQRGRPARQQPARRATPPRHPPRRPALLQHRDPQPQRLPRPARGDQERVRQAARARRPDRRRRSAGRRRPCPRTHRRPGVYQTRRHAMHPS